MRYGRFNNVIIHQAMPLCLCDSILPFKKKSEIMNDEIGQTFPICPFVSFANHEHNEHIPIALPLTWKQYKIWAYITQMFWMPESPCQKERERETNEFMCWKNGTSCTVYMHIHQDRHKHKIKCIFIETIAFYLKIQNCKRQWMELFYFIRYAISMGFTQIHKHNRNFSIDIAISIWRWMFSLSSKWKMTLQNVFRKFFIFFLGFPYHFVCVCDVVFLCVRLLQSKTISFSMENLIWCIDKWNDAFREEASNKLRKTEGRPVKEGEEDIVDWQWRNNKICIKICSTLCALCHVHIITNVKNSIVQQQKKCASETQRIPLNQFNWYALTLV